MLDTFYTTVAQASFTLLALWWVLLQIRHDEWFADTAYRRSAYDVSLYFLLPGMMSLGSLLAVEEPWIWRANFAFFGALGFVWSVLLVARRGPLRSARLMVRVSDLLSVLLFALVVAAALWTTFPDDLGIDLQPLEAEGFFVGSLLLLGVMLASAIFVSTGPAARHDRRGD
jgi:hypothetical protein